MLRLGFLALLAALGGLAPAVAQTAALAASSTALNSAGASVTFSFAASFSGGAAFVTLEVALPSGWTYLGGSGEPGVKPAANTQGSLSWTSLSAQASSVQFTFNASYPAGAAATSVTSAVTLRQTVQVVVTDKNGVQTTETREVRTDLRPAAIGFGSPPAITTQPQAATVGVGGAVNFGLNATGSPPFTYQWFKNGTALAGATNASLALTNVQTTDSGSYTVTVTNPVGTITSSAALFTVTTSSGGGSVGGGGGLPPPTGGGSGGGGSTVGGGATATTPTITAQPVGQVVAVGSTVSLSVTASGTAPFTYQWSKNGAAIAGASNAALAVANAQASDSGTYRVTITNAAGSITSTAAQVTIDGGAVFTPPAITAQPAGATVVEGGTASFAVTATGTAPLTYQWRRNGAALSGATNATLTIVGVLLADAGNYAVVVTNRAGSITTATGLLTVTPAATRPVVTVQPQGLSALVGASVTLAVTATGTPPLSYQWSKDGAPLVGATGATLSLANLQAANAGNYSIVVTNALGSTPSAAAPLTLTATAVAPTIATQPVAQSAAPGASATFSVVADGTAPFTYQWRRNGAVLAGATAASLALTDLRLADAGSYSVAITNSVGTTTSGAASLTVAPPPGAPAILAEPADLTIGAGARVNFRVSASGTAPLAYEWRKNGLTISTAATLSLSAVQAADAGAYTVVVTNALGSVTSRAAALTIRGRSYVGSYFGILGGGGSFALNVRDDNTGVFLGYSTGSRTAIVSRDIFVSDDGRFSFVSVASTQPSAATIAAAGVEFTISGAIGADGSLAGSIAAPGAAPTSLAATRSATIGAAQSVAGFYQAGATASSATTYTIVSPAGQAFVLTVTPTTSDAGTGTVDATGRVAVTTANNATVAGTLSAATATLSASVTTATGARLDFTGGSDARPTTEKLVNIATRGAVGGAAGEMIAGFVLKGDAPKQVMVRAIGPTLGAFGVAGGLSAARLELFSGPASIATNAGWGNSPDIVAAAQRVGAFALTPGSRDAVLLVTLEPGAYTAVVSGVGVAAGVALVEAYDVSENAAANQKVINIASRAFAGSGDSILTAGFVIDGAVPKRVLVRGIGPALTAFGVTGALADPQLRLVSQATGATVATNDNWRDTADAAAITSAAGSVGAFALNAGSKDAALFLNLAPGAYTVQLSGPGNATGTALIEVYEVP
jgi:hypothetical protein